MSTVVLEHPLIPTNEMGVKSHGLVLTRLATWETFHDFASVKTKSTTTIKTNKLPTFA